MGELRGTEDEGVESEMPSEVLFFFLNLERLRNEFFHGFLDFLRFFGRCFVFFFLVLLMNMLYLKGLMNMVVLLKGRTLH